MPKFVQEILDNLDFDFDFNFETEIPDFPSGSDCLQQSSQTAEEEIWHKSEAEIELDGHVW